jgi:hypothetical protein
VKQRLRIVAFTTIVFAGIGFSISWILLAYSAYVAHANHEIPNEKIFLTLCPASVLSLALDNASVFIGLLGWLLIALINAFLYAVPGVAIGFLIAVICPRGLLGLLKGHARKP